MSENSVGKGASFGVFVPRRGRTRRLRCPGKPLDSNPGSSFAFARRLVSVLDGTTIQNGNSG